MRYLSNAAEDFDTVSGTPIRCAAPTFLDQNLKNSRHDLMHLQWAPCSACALAHSLSGDGATDPTRRSYPSLWTQACARAPLETTLQPSAAVRGRREQMYGRMLQ